MLLFVNVILVDVFKWTFCSTTICQSTFRKSWFCKSTLLFVIIRRRFFRRHYVRRRLCSFILLQSTFSQSTFCKSRFCKLMLCYSKFVFRISFSSLFCQPCQSLYVINLLASVLSIFTFNYPAPHVLLGGVEVCKNLYQLI